MPEDLDIERPGELEAYLRRAGRLAAGERVVVTTLAGGVSNRTVLVERDAGESWVVKQALPKLRVAVDWFSDVRRIEREALGMRALADLAPPGTITRLIFEDPDHHLLAMEAVPRPHENWKAMLLRGQVADDHVRQFGTLLGTVHRRAREPEWQARCRTPFEDVGFFRSLRLEPYFEYAATQEPRAADFLHGLVARNLTAPWTLVHGDYSPKNILVHAAAAAAAGRLVLLDHEVIHWGNGAFDVGFALAHLLSKAHHLPQHRDAFAAAARSFWSSYSQALQDDRLAQECEWQAVHQALGCLLARVCGRSPLEYLAGDEKLRQREAIVRLMPRPPSRLAQLVEAFLGGL